MDLKESLKIRQDMFVNLVQKAVFSKSGNEIGSDECFGDILSILKETKRTKGRLFFIGNGASCSMASHFSTDFTKNAGICSSSLNEGTLLTCFSNDFSYEVAYMEMLKRFMNNGDVLFVISSSGKSKNIVNAADYVRNNLTKSKVVGFSGFNKDNPLSLRSDYSIYIDSNEYGFVESAHAYYLHALIDLFIKYYN
jgi:D-sedoheptulose 7-phosphate isomerase